MDSEAYFRDHIRQFLRDTGLTVRDFARIADVELADIKNIQTQRWRPDTTVVERCLRAIVRHEADEDLKREPSEIDLPWRMLCQEGFEDLLECAAVWSALGRDRLTDAMDLLNRHNLGDRLVVTRMEDNDRLFMEKFSPWTWGYSNAVADRPVSNLPDRRFGRWAEASIVKQIRGNQPRLVSCRIPIETAMGRFVVPYTAIRLPFGPLDIPSHVMTISRLEKGTYSNLYNAGPKMNQRAPANAKRSPAAHLRLVKS